MSLFRALFVTCALFLCAASASAQTDVIRGRVTTGDGEALPGVRVMATSIPGNVTRETRTDGRGNFQILFPGGTADYMMGYALIGYVYRTFQIKRLADEDVLIANANLSVIQLDTIAVVASVQQRVNRNSDTPDVGGTEQRISQSDLPPELQGDIAAMAASLPGVLLVPGVEGEPDGFSVLGLGADQNSVTLNGMQFGANNLPRDAAISSSLTTSPYDASRGGFSGGNLNIQTGGGSNFQRRGMSAVLNTPRLQWTDPAARALGTEYTNVSLGGMAAGPIVLNKAFYNISYQLGRQSRDNQTLPGTSALGLQTAGVSSDSVERLVEILEISGVPVAGPLRSSRVSDNGSVFGSVDLSPPSSTSGQSYHLTFNGNWRKQSPVGSGPTQFASAGGDRYDWGGGIQARHSGYFKLVLSETAVGFNVARDDGDPYLTLPAGRVRVTSTLPDGSNGVQSLVFGGNQGLSAFSRSSSSSIQNTLSWFDNGNKHRLKLTTEMSYRGATSNRASNLLGTFVFNSLEDLEAGRPASFSRTLRANERTSGTVNTSVALGDSYRRTEDLQIQYGARVDMTRYTTRPQFNPAIEATFGRRNDVLPTPVVVSPRIGFSWTVGESEEIAAFRGAARRPRAVIRGGIGMFTNARGAGQLNSALENTGLPNGTQQIMCVGPAVPIPDWDAYAAGAAIPEQCADGTTGTVFSNGAPAVTVFAPDFMPQRTIRSNLSWNGTILDERFRATLEGTYALNRNQQRTVDLNFDGVTRFSLGDDGRPVFVDTSSIVASTGVIASRDARVSQAFARVPEVRSDLTSRTAQLSLHVSPIVRGPSRFGWNAAYTYTRVDEQVSGFSSTAGNPLLVAWSRSGQGPHQISYTLRYEFFDAVSVNWTGSFRSGAAYTPMVAGDVNGDGYSNDRAFIFAPGSAGDSAVDAGMAQLLAGASGAARECLQRQLGQIAARNSCRAPWTSSASLNITLDRARFRMPHRASVSFSLSNPLGAADLLLNGSGNLRGWGQNAFPDQSLLHVRGFDSQTRRYRYEVNQRFGATRPQFTTLRSPVTLTTSVRIDLGPTRERQNVEEWTGRGRNRPGTRFPESFFRSVGANGLMNPMSVILRQQDSLRLTSRQADSLAVLNRRYTYRADSLWAPVARDFAALGPTYDADEVYDRYMRARRAQIAMLEQLAPAIRGLLTAEQRRRLPASVGNILDARYLASIRNGTGLYVGGGGRGGGRFFGRED